jgi:signal transduction histidine kinase
LVSIKLNENDIKYEMDVDDVMIHSDYDQLQTVLINFINNAINHIKEPKQLKIYSEKDKDKIRLLVFNTGQPILEEDITQLWDSFYKVDKARTRRYGGHGLGLSICRTIFEALNYTYGVLNLETGVAFYFDIKI